MRGLVLAWAVGLGLMTWRDVQEYHKPPIPGRLLGASLVYVALALVAELGPNAARTAALIAWGFDIMVLLQIPPDQLTSTAGFGPPGTPGADVPRPGRTKSPLPGGQLPTSSIKPHQIPGG